ncbi:MAG: hypothetical protein HYY52_01600 [Candidatus Melainabacteria bacterium]|nr:hypothetical protein [Candidatus Melainabacteria bacterium]
MDELNLDAESVTRNKTYDSFDHLKHLLKVGWPPDSQLIKKYLKENNLSNNDLHKAIELLRNTF